MGLRADQKIVIVTRKTRLEELIERFNTREQARFYVKRARENMEVGRGKQLAKVELLAEADFAAYEDEHNAYHESLKQVRSSMELGIKVQVIDRAFLPNFLFGASDIVVTVGQDGLVANTAKYALGLPIVAVNPDPARYDGILLPYRPEEAAGAAALAINNRGNIKRVTLAEATLNDGQKLLAFNDLFIGNRTHISARYRIESCGKDECHSSSGILVSTGAGSTGWLSSVFNMAAGITQIAGHRTAFQPLRMPWDDPRLFFVVREPFLSKASGISIAAGMIESGNALTIESQMPANGVIFSDGVESDYLAFNSGAIASIHAAKEQALLMVK